MKKQTCVYIEESVIKACKEQGINMSEVTEKALKAVLTGQHFRDEEAHLDFLVRQKQLDERRKKELEEQLRLVSTRLQKREQQLQTQQDLVEVVQKSRVVASLIKSMNDIIKSLNYDVEQSWQDCQPLVQELKEYEHPVTKDWFAKQVKRLASGALD